MFSLALALFVQSYVDPEDIDRASLAVVNPGIRRHFRESPTGCAANDSRCHRRGYVLPGDQVIRYETRNRFARIEFVDARGRSSIGWIEAKALSPAEGSPRLPWTGEWSRPSQRLRIAAASAGRYHVQGDATYFLRDRVWGMHYGMFRVTAQPRDGRFAFATDPLNADEGGYTKALPYDPAEALYCQIRMRRLGIYLLVHNGRCGGEGVTFNGVYRQIRKGSQPLPGPQR